MNSHLQWQLFLKAKGSEQAARLLKAFAEALGVETTVIECERYWKDDSLFRARVSCPLPAAEPSAAVWEALQLCWRVARTWTVGAPQFYEGGRWELSGGADLPAISLAGITQIDFQAGNLPPPTPEVASSSIVENVR